MASRAKHTVLLDVVNRILRDVLWASRPYGLFCVFVVLMYALLYVCVRPALKVSRRVLVCFADVNWWLSEHVFVCLFILILQVIHRALQLVLCASLAFYEGFTNHGCCIAFCADFWVFHVILVLFIVSLSHIIYFPLVCRALGAGLFGIVCPKEAIRSSDVGVVSSLVSRAFTELYD